MSTEQENFDDLLKSKLDASEFVFNEDNWDKAEQLIIQAEKKRKRRRIGFIFFIGMTLGICTMIPFVSNKKSINKEGAASEKRNINMNEKVEIDTENSENKVKKNYTNENSSKENEPINILSTDKSYDNKQEEVQLQKEELNNSNSKSLQNQKNNSPVMAYMGGGEKEKAKTSNQNRIENLEKNNPEVISKKGKKGTVSKEASDKINTEAEEVKESKKVSSIYRNETKSIATVTSESKQDSVSPISQQKKDTVIVVKDSIAIAAKIDSVKPTVKDTPKAFKKLTIISIDGGASYSFGWANNSIQEANGFNAIFGISIDHQFTKKWGVLAGIQYNSLTHLNYSNYTSNNLQYDLGYNQIKTVITPTMLYYMAIPIKLQYFFNKKNSLSVGINTSYLLNTNSKVETYSQSTFGASVYNVSTKKGYMDGFSTWDLQPALTYRRRIVKCLSLSAEVYYGLIDLKKNTVFGPIKSEHNSGLKLTLSYNFLHK